MNNNKKYHKGDFRSLFISVIVFLLLFAYFLTYKNYKQKNTDFLISATEKLNNEYHITIDVYEDMAEAIFNLAINTEEIISIVENGMTSTNIDVQNLYREQLLNILGPLYLEITKYHFRQLHFHTKDNISFLRFHKPKTFGDDLTKIRYSIDYVNREFRSISGFEEGRIFNGYRFVFPIKSGDKHIGSVEVSTSLLAIIDQLESRFDLPAQFIIDKRVVDEKVFESEKSNYMPSNISDNYVLDRDIYNKNKVTIPVDMTFKDKCAIGLKKSRFDKKPFTILSRNKDIDKLTVFLPILNLKNEVVAFLITSTETLEIEKNKINFIKLSLLYFSLFIIIFIFGSYYDKTRKTITALANIDYLTHTHMRRILIERMEIEIARFFRYGSQVSIIMLDIDKFKNINDKYGHKAGDKVLKKIAGVIKNGIRQTDTVGRYGGEEFIVLLPETELKEATAIAEHIRIKIEELVIIDIPTITVSCGVDQFKDNTKNTHNFINRVDQRLYKAKKTGRNRVVWN